MENKSFDHVKGIRDLEYFTVMGQLKNLIFMLQYSV